MDVLSKSDPQIQVLLADAQGVYREIGKTEMINNNLDPKYAQIVLGFLFAHFVFSKKKKKKRVLCFALLFLFFDGCVGSLSSL
jgi:hypothetical protein